MSPQCPVTAKACVAFTTSLLCTEICAHTCRKKILEKTKTGHNLNFSLYNIMDIIMNNVYNKINYVLQQDTDVKSISGGGIIVY